MPTTLQALRQAIGTRLGWMDLGTLTGVDLNNLTADDSARFDGDGYWNEGWLRVYALASLASYAQVRRIQTWVQSATRFTVYGALSSLTGVETYEVWRYVSPTVVDREILAAIRRSSPHLQRNLTDATLTITAGTYTITIPAAFRNQGVQRIEALTPGTGTPEFVIPDWRYRGDGTTVELPAWVVDGYGGYTLRLFGVGNMSEPTTDTGTVEVDWPETDVIVLAAVVELMTRRLSEEPVQTQEKLMRSLGYRMAEYQEAIRKHGKRMEYGTPGHGGWGGPA